jgi:hypothetical protein
LLPIGALKNKRRVRRKKTKGERRKKRKGKRREERDRKRGEKVGRRERSISAYCRFVHL